MKPEHAILCRWVVVLGTLSLVFAPRPGIGQVVPDPRAHHQLVYHAGEEQAFLIGGSTQRGEGYFYFDEMWSWNGTNWIQEPPMPFPRSSHRVIYNAKRNSLILFGGGFGQAIRAEGVLWEWRRGVWKALGGSFQAGRNEPGMCYDQKRERVVIFGGWDTSSTYRGETLEWTGEGLVQVDSTGPRPRAGHAFLYDSVRQRCLLFGGRGAEGYLADTWEWNGTTWRRIEAVGPPARWFFGSATDPANGRIVIFGGRGPDGDLGDTWAWDGKRWKQLIQEGPSARSMAKLAFSGHNVVLFGGREETSEGFQDRNDTWELRGETWEQRR